MSEFSWHLRCFPNGVRHFGFAFVLTFCMWPLQGATLERLSFDDMVQKATAIVRGTVTASRAAPHGPIVYTHYTLQVTETFKGTPGSMLDMVVPGGVANNIRQSFAGTPSFRTGDDYVFFLWTGQSELTYILGLTQGLFALTPGTPGNPLAIRGASKEIMLEPGTGRQVKDQTVVMHLSDLRSLIASTLKGTQTH
ncbi:MAG: hypothetical protein JO099_06995 [Acidobacteriia bacterium]|nr:hypothetical protein [Terriglobia bacterium]